MSGINQNSYNGEGRLKISSSTTTYLTLGYTGSSQLDFNLPTNYGSSGQGLITNGTGGLSWGSVSGSGTNGTSGSSGVGILATQSLLQSEFGPVWVTSGTTTNQDGGWIMTGGTFVSITHAGLTVQPNTLYISTVHIPNGETLQSVRWNLNVIGGGTGSVDIGLYSISKLDVFQNNATYSAFRVGKLLKTITTSYPYSGSLGPHQINNIGYTANKNDTFYEIYALIYRADSGVSHSLKRPTVNGLIPHLGGTFEATNFSRQFAISCGTASSLPADLSSNVITPSTQGGAIFSIRKTQP